jgi:uncharacterized protein YpmB
MKKWLIILIVIVLIIIIAILLSNLPFDVTPNNNVSYEQICGHEKIMVLMNFDNMFVKYLIFQIKYFS